MITLEEYMPTNTNTIPSILLAMILIDANLISPSLRRFSVSKLNVEKVVYAPMKPIVIKLRH
jgi:hypothetical protein